MMLNQFRSRSIVTICSALVSWAAPAAAAESCPITSEIFLSQKPVVGGGKLVPAGPGVTVVLKANIHPDGTADISVVRSSGITALNDLAVNWVHTHWRWPRGCPPGSSRQIQLGFSHSSP
jgi:hypothetical protein